MKHIFILLLGLSLFSCKKFDEELGIRETDSGVVFVGRKAGGGPVAKIAEEIEVFAKIGVPDAALQFYVGNVAVEPLNRESRMVKVPNYNAGDSVLLPMEVFTFLVPEGATLGPTNVYFTANGVKRTPMELFISKPDILYPGKVIVEPYIIVKDSEQPVDGPLATAGVGQLEDISYDAANKVFYMLEWYTNSSTNEPYYVVRQLKDSVITTLAGGGDDIDATVGRQRDLGRVLSMKRGPDGKLYLGVMTGVWYDSYDGQRHRQDRPEIIRLDPATGNIEHLAGGKTRTGNNYEGIRDGRENALLSEPSSMTFDPAGNLYFIDKRALIRKVSTDGMVSTLFGKVDSFAYETIDYRTGNMTNETFFLPVEEHTDGFGDEARFYGAMKIVMAGNGKLYVLEEPGWEYQENIREINPDTKEVSTIIGQPAGSRSFVYSGTFKEVELSGVSSFDVDYDGNLLITNFFPLGEQGMIYKMDLQQETVTYLAGGGPRDEASVLQPQPGNNAAFVYARRIVFDQFGSLYVVDGQYGVQIKKITIER
ncbi:NHL repeat-containing protein [Chitinophaga cymbidii]|nr:hypothetical protein [Chitinophaga cymbidii]